MRYVLVGLMVALCLVFGVSAFGKVRSAAAHRAFAASLREWRVVPARLVAPVSGVVAGGEIAIVVGAGYALAAMAVGGTWRVAAVATLVLAGLLLAALTTGIALALRRGTAATCACFGARQRPLNGGHLVRNSVLLLAVAGGLAVAAGADRPFDPAGVLLGVAAGALAGLVVVQLDDLIELFAPRSSSGRTR
jgi:hypothetical protein